MIIEIAGYLIMTAICSRLVVKIVAKTPRYGSWDWFDTTMCLIVSLFWFVTLPFALAYYITALLGSFGWTIFPFEKWYIKDSKNARKT